MPQSIEGFVVPSRIFPVLTRRYDRFHSLLFGLLNNRIAIASLVCEQLFCRQALYQATGLGAVRCCTLCNNDTDWHPMRIHGKMQFCVEPPLVRLMS